MNKGTLNVRPGRYEVKMALSRRQVRPIMILLYNAGKTDGIPYDVLNRHDIKIVTAARKRVGQ